MDDHRTFQTALQTSQSQRRLSGFKILFASFITFTATLFSFSSTLAAVGPRITSQADWALAQNSNLPSSTLQISFPSVMFDRDKDFFSELAVRFPRYFSQLKLNTLGREFHYSIAYFSDLSLEELETISKEFRQIPAEAFREFDLLGDFEVFDPENIELILVGHSNRFVALKPHAELVGFIQRSFKMFQKYAPKTFEKLGDFSKHFPHISLVQFSGLSEEQENEVLRQVRELAKQSFERLKKRHGTVPHIRFSLEKNPYQIIAPAVSISAPGPVLLSLKSVEGKPSVSQIARWRISDKGVEGGQSLIELESTQAGLRPRISDRPIYWNRPNWQEFEPISWENVKKNVSPDLTSVVDIFSGQLSPTRLPSIGSRSSGSDGGVFLIASKAHPKLDPGRAEKHLILSRSLGLHSVQGVFSGVGVYASSVKSNVKNPADTDLLINSLIQVPEGLKTVEDAERYVAGVFDRVVFGQLREQIAKRNLAITEVRIGSDVTMGYEVDDLIEGLENNPYGTHDDFVQGKIKDQHGKTWDISRLVEKTKDFIKLKVDHFEKVDGQLVRHPLSLQFQIGFVWNGTIHYLQRNALKGVPALTRTCVYDGYESYAIAAAISRAKDLYTLQLGSAHSRAIRDTMKIAFGSQEKFNLFAPIHTSPKVLKVFERLLYFFAQDEARVDEVIFDGVKLLMTRDGLWSSSFKVGEFIERIVEAFNQPELQAVNELKHVVNDLREFNERGQRMTEEQWITRKSELAGLFPKLRRTFSNPERASFVQPLLPKLSAFEELLDSANRLTTVESVSALFNKPENHAILYAFEKGLGSIEEFLVGPRNPASKLREIDTVFIQRYLSYAPFIYANYLFTREQAAEVKIEWTMRQLGIEYSPEKRELFETVSRRIYTLSEIDFVRAQKAVWGSGSDRRPINKSGSSCDQALTALAIFRKGVGR